MIAIFHYLIPQYLSLPHASDDQILIISVLGTSLLAHPYVQYSSMFNPLERYTIDPGPKHPRPPPPDNHVSIQIGRETLPYITLRLTLTLTLALLAGVFMFSSHRHVSCPLLLAGLTILASSGECLNSHNHNRARITIIMINN